MYVCLFVYTQVVPKSKSNGLHNGHAYSEPSSVQANHTETVCQATQVGAGQGGEGAGDGGGPPMRRSRDAGREGMRDHGWRERELKALSLIFLEYLSSPCLFFFIALI